MKRRRSGTFVVVGLILATAIGGLAADRHITENQLRESSGELLLLMGLRRSALESYFDTVRSELTFWSLNERLHDSVSQLQSAWDEMPGSQREQLQAGYIRDNPYPKANRRLLEQVDDGSGYGPAHAQIHDLARSFVSERGYYDFFLIAPSGDILYTVEKEIDFATNLVSGEWSNSGLADVYRRALESSDEPRVVFSDFARYPPSDDAPALFAAVPIRGAAGSVTGVLAVQLPTERIQSIMQFTAGMGRSGETYLVGGDYLMRSDSRFSEESTTLKVRVEGETVKLALSSQTGVAFVDDYRGIEVLSAYGRFTLDEVDWAVMAEIDREELYEEIASRRLMVPAIGAALLLLSMVTFWYIDVADLSMMDFDPADITDPGDTTSL